MSNSDLKSWLDESIIIALLQFSAEHICEEEDHLLLELSSEFVAFT